jgi:hypothetical protein
MKITHFGVIGQMVFIKVTGYQDWEDEVLIRFAVEGGKIFQLANTPECIPPRWEYTQNNEVSRAIREHFGLK